MFDVPSADGAAHYTISRSINNEGEVAGNFIYRNLTRRYLSWVREGPSRQCHGVCGPACV